MPQSYPIITFSFLLFQGLLKFLPQPYQLLHLSMVWMFLSPGEVHLSQILPCPAGSSSVSMSGVEVGDSLEKPHPKRLGNCEATDPGAYMNQPSRSEPNATLRQTPHWEEISKDIVLKVGKE